MNSVYSCITGSFSPLMTIHDKMWWKAIRVSCLYWLSYFMFVTGSQINKGAMFLFSPVTGSPLSATPWYGLQTDHIHKTPESLQSLSHFHVISLHICFRGRHNLYNEQHPELVIKVSLHSCICSGCLIVSANVAAQIMSVFTSCPKPWALFMFLLQEADLTY